MLFRVLKSMPIMNTRRTYKNFGHKRQPEAPITVLWHGFLTFTFIGMGIEWKRIAQFFFGDENEDDDGPWKHEPFAKARREAQKKMAMQGQEES